MCPLHSALGCSVAILVVVSSASLWSPLAIAQSSPAGTKLGPPGNGAAHCIGGQQPLAYRIRFENLSNATAPAQRMVISDPLSLTTLDPSTVSLDVITFGNVHIVPPPGLRSYATQVDLRPRALRCTGRPSDRRQTY